jgi:hypothetical protein
MIMDLVMANYAKPDERDDWFMFATLTKSPMLVWDPMVSLG